MSDSILKETLFSSSTVRLFGREFEGLTLGHEEGDPATLKGAPPALRALQAQLKLRTGQEDLKPLLARIYGFSYLGTYYKLAEPTVLLVYGQGKPVPSSTAAVALDDLGVEFKEETFTSEVLMWAQDRGDYSVRIDITAGFLADVLVDPGMIDATNTTTGQAPDGSGRGGLVGRAQMVGRAQLVGRAQMVGRGNSG